MIDEQFLKQQKQLYLQLKQYDAQQDHRLARYGSMELESVLFLSQLITLQNSQNILEIGTSAGFTTLWVAKVLENSTGHLISVEKQPERSIFA